MRRIISPKDMREQETDFFAQGEVRSIDVMERAASAVAERIRAAVPRGSRVYFACGSGGNGGDGLACARLLRDSYDTAILRVFDLKTDDARTNLARALEAGVPVYTWETLPGTMPDAWCDAIFGTGLSRAAGGTAAAVIERINTDHARGAFVIAADIPSGLNGATGKAYAPCVAADETVTFGWIKTGLVLNDGLDMTGLVTLADVGFPDFPRTDGALLDADDVRRLLPPRKRCLHKGQCGHLLIVAGSFGMAGAAAMCATAALRSGVGLVTVACPVSVVPILQTLAPQAMCVPLAERDGAISAEALPVIRDALKGKSAAVIGPGLSLRAAPDAVRAVLESGLPAVIDADALNLIARSATLRSMTSRIHVLTPHPGEARRLLGDAMTDDPLGNAHTLCEMMGGAAVLYKGASCIITDEYETYVSASGCSGMARGGSGDVLSGILGALLAEPSDRSPALTAALASEVHGLAGERAQCALGNRAMNAFDLKDYLPDIFRD